MQIAQTEYRKHQPLCQYSSYSRHGGGLCAKSCIAAAHLAKLHSSGYSKILQPSSLTTPPYSLKMDNDVTVEDAVRDARRRPLVISHTNEE